MNKRSAASEKAQSDQRLLRALLQPRTTLASHTAFVRRFERLIAGCVIKVLRRYTVHVGRDDVDDMVNDAWLALWAHDMRRLRRYDGGRGVTVASYVAMIATNSAIDGLRRRSEATESLEELPAWREVALPATDDPVEVAERAHIARLALSQLSDKDQAFVRQIFQEECAPEEVARGLGVRTSTVYARKFKLRARLATLAAQVAA